MRADVLLIDAGDVLGAARPLHHLPREELAEIPPDFLLRAAQLLRAGAYNASEAARRMEAVARMQQAKASCGSAADAVIVCERRSR